MVAPAGVGAVGAGKAAEYGCNLPGLINCVKIIIENITGIDDQIRLHLVDDFFHFPGMRQTDASTEVQVGDKGDAQNRSQSFWRTFCPAVRRMCERG